MNPITPNCADGSLYDYLKGIFTLPGSPINKDILFIPEEKGNGFIKSFYLEQGLFIRYYNFCVNEDLTFGWFPVTTGGTPVYKLIVSLSDTKNLTTTTRENADHSTVLYSTDFIRTLVIPKHTWVKRVALLFTKEWIENNFKEASEKIQEHITLLINKNKPTFMVELMPQEYYRLVHEITLEMDKDKFPLLHIKTKSHILLNEFLNKLVYRESAAIASNQSVYFAQIMQVEASLSEYLDKEMPNISQLARQFNLSAATLKRHFKIIYGKSIYQYYLEKKLALGKQMLSEKTKTISEIAYSLGYNKINSFSKVFKKHHGVLPKNLREQ